LFSSVFMSGNTGSTERLHRPSVSRELSGFDFQGVRWFSQIFGQNPRLRRVEHRTAARKRSSGQWFSVSVRDDSVLTRRWETFTRISAENNANVVEDSHQAAMICCKARRSNRAALETCLKFDTLFGKVLKEK
jgi:hypothetical protein